MKLDVGSKGKSYGQRVAEQQAQTGLDAVKNKGKPLGGAPPIPEGKLSQLLPMPEMRFGETEEPPSNLPRQVQEPTMIPGVGSAYAVNQALARGEIDRPVSLGEARNLGLGGQARPPISDETMELMKKMSAANKENAPEKKETPAEKLEKVEKEIVEDNKSPIQFDLEALDAFRRDLYSDKRRKEIEDKLPPLEIDDLIMKGEVTQEVSIVSGKLKYMLRTFSQTEHIWCLQYVYNFPGSTRYVEELLNTFKVVCAVVAVNGKPLPDHRKNIGQRNEEVDKELFERKLAIIRGWPVQLLADIGVQCNWFNDRVTALFTASSLKNG